MPMFDALEYTMFDARCSMSGNVKIQGDRCQMLDVRE